MNLLSTNYMNFITKLKRFLRRSLEKFNFIEKQTVCFSQEGEDLILDELFSGLKNGFYIDVGAYHPYRFSNTYLFYSKGWTGINIDARPGSMEMFKRLRPNDINLELAVGLENKTLDYFMFDEPGLNGFSKEISENRDKNTPFKIINKVEISLKRLEDVLETHMPKNREIDFMSIDVEGFDFEVLASNNWDKFRPRIILIETSVTSDGLALGSPIDSFLNSKNYSLIAKTFRTSFYQLNVC